jgi:hypothetical protein
LHLRGETKKYIFCKAGIPNAFFAGDKAKIVYFVEGKDLFTHLINSINTYFMSHGRNFTIN